MTNISLKDFEDILLSKEEDEIDNFIREYQNNSEITLLDKKLFSEALDISKFSYSPFSKFRVGSAILTKEGKIVKGVNVENSSFGATICAERTAAASAVTKGYKDFLAIAIASPDGEAFPCGICRQFLYEFSGDLIVISGKDIEHLKKYPLRKMLLEGFRLNK